MTDALLASRLSANLRFAFRQNLVPALYLQALTVLVAVSYFSLPAARPLFDFFAHLKTEGGRWFAVLSTSLSGGLIPYLYLRLSKKIRERPLAQAAFYVVVWGFMGLLVDTLYTAQAVWFGAEGDFLTVAKKVAVDQLFFSTLVSSPFLTAAYLWKDQGFDGAKARALINREFFALKIPTTLAANWIVWTPAVCVIYALPSPLQLPLFNIVLCFFVLLLSVLRRD